MGVSALDAVYVKIIAHYILCVNQIFAQYMRIDGGLPHTRLIIASAGEGVNGERSGHISRKRLGTDFHKIRFRSNSQDIQTVRLLTGHAGGYKSAGLP